MGLNIWWILGNGKIISSDCFLFVVVLLSIWKLNGVKIWLMVLLIVVMCGGIWILIMVWKRFCCDLVGLDCIII